MTTGVLAAPSDEIDELFREGVKLLRQHQDAKALEKFKAILRQDPANEAVYKLWRESEESVWIRLLMKQGEYEKVAKAFISRAKVERKKRMADAELIGKLVANSLSDDFATRRQANIQLAQDHGEYAVPALLEHLGNVDEEDNQLYAQVALVEMGPQVVLPLLEALHSGNALLRRNIAIVLRRLGDTRALPELKHLALADEDAMVKKVADAAIAKLGGTAASPSELFVARARDFRAGGNIGRYEQGDAIWRWKEGQLTYEKILPLVFPIEVARQSAYKGLAADPANEAAKVEIALSYLAERAAVAEQLAAGETDEALVELNNRLLKSQVVVAAAGRDIMRQAAAQAVGQGDAFLCRMAFDALGRLENADSLASSPLLAALDNANAIIRTEAALTVSQLDPQGIAAPAGKVANVLADAANNRLVRLVVTMGLTDDTRNVSEAMGRKSEFSILNASSGAEGLNITAAADIYVINFDLPRLTAIDVINTLRRDPKSAGKKILVVAKDLKKAKGDLQGLKVDGFLAEASATDLAKLEKFISETLEGFQVNLGRTRAVRLAKAAAGRLAAIDARKFNLGAIEGKLMKALDHEEDQVVLGILAALAETGSARSVEALAALAASERSLEVRVSAAKALGQVVSRHGGLTDQVIDNLAKVVGGDADLELRSAVAAALGQANLDAVKRAELLKLLRM